MTTAKEFAIANAGKRISVFNKNVDLIFDAIVVGYCDDINAGYVVAVRLLSNVNVGHSCADIHGKSYITFINGLEKFFAKDIMYWVFLDDEDNKITVYDTFKTEIEQLIRALEL